MKISAEIDVKKLRRIAHLIINKTLSEIKAMPDEELVLACVKNSLYCADNIKVVNESEETNEN